MTLFALGWFRDFGAFLQIQVFAVFVKIGRSCERETSATNFHRRARRKYGIAETAYV